jgi:hypothetical protein
MEGEKVKYDVPGGCDGCDGEKKMSDAIDE